MEIIFVAIIILAFIGGIAAWINESDAKNAMEGLLSNPLANKSFKMKYKVNESQRLFDAVQAGKVPNLEYAKKYNKIWSGTSDEINENNGSFNASKKYISAKIGIAYSATTKKFAFLTPTSRIIVCPDQFVSVEVCVDSETLINTNKTSLIGGALLGGALTGGVGALVMALGAKKKQQENIKSVELKILLLDYKDSVYTINFTDTMSPRYAFESAGEWHDLIKVAMEDVSRRKKNTQNLPSNSIANELNQLNKMHLEGLLSLDEFERAKNKLLR